MERKNLFKFSVSISLTIFLSLAIYLVVNYYYFNKEILETSNIENYIKNTSSNNSNNSYSVSDENYSMIIKIPSITLNKGVSDESNIDKGIVIHQESVMPNVQNGLLILMAHSGNNYNSYFKDLYKLNYSDISYIYFNGTKYTYELTKYYNIDKTGYLNFNRDLLNTQLMLITCKNNNEQTIYLFTLLYSENY